MLAILLYGTHVVAVPMNSEMQPISDDHDSANIVRRSPQDPYGTLDHQAVDAANVDDFYGSVKIVRRSPEALHCETDH